MVPCNRCVYDFIEKTQKLKKFLGFLYTFAAE